MDKQLLKDVVSLFVFSLLLAASVFSLGIGIGKHTIEKQAVERGCAQYNPTTGDWEWAHGKATNDRR